VEFIGNLIVWIVLGGLAGWIASMFTGRNDQMGCWANIAVGMVGAFLGGWLFNLVGQPGVTGFNLWSFLVALVGAFVLLALLNLVTRRRR
jgi:uncharacterized membrane protein YeaQ/YmgE (transglycosylase-associated protein family)